MCSLTNELPVWIEEDRICADDILCVCVREREVNPVFLFVYIMRVCVLHSPDSVCASSSLPLCYLTPGWGRPAALHAGKAHLSAYVSSAAHGLIRH